MVFGIDGIWWAIVFAETAALVMSGTFYLRHRKRYHY